MKLKPGVKIQGMTPGLLLGLIVANGVYADYEQDMVVTSVVDSKHSETSLHYSGCAADLRTTTAGIGIGQAGLIAKDIKAALGVDFDVLVEDDHIHLEYQPRQLS